jgi:DNA-binding Lrp family transcriptional regulator
VSAAHNGRLRPGQLDGLVLGYLRERSKDGPLTATAIAKGISRSAGAVSNCLARLAKTKQVRQATKAPRAYVLRAEGKAR